MSNRSRAAASLLGPCKSSPQIATPARPRAQRLWRSGLLA